MTTLRARISQLERAFPESPVAGDVDLPSAEELELIVVAVARVCDVSEDFVRQVALDHLATWRAEPVEDYLARVSAEFRLTPAEFLQNGLPVLAEIERLRAERLACE